MAHSDNTGSTNTAHNVDLPSVWAKQTVGPNEAVTQADLASMVGYETPDVSSARSQSVSLEAGLLDESDLGIDEDRRDEFDGEPVNTTTPLWANPYVKLSFVAGCSLFCFWIIAQVFSSIQTAGTRDLTPDIVVGGQSGRDGEVVDPFEIALQRQQEEIGDLKTQNALGNQQQALELQETQRETLSQAELLALRNRQLAQVAQAAQAAQAEGALTSRAQDARPVVASAPPAPPVMMREATPGSSARSAPAVAEPVEVADPLETWNQLAKLGSYGQGSYVAHVPPPPEVAPSSASRSPDVSAIARPEASPSPPNPVFSSGGRVIPERSTATMASFQVDESPTYAQEEAALLGHTVKTVKSGTFAPARLVTPIYWAQDLADEEQSQRSVLELTEPILAHDGSIAISSGALLVVEVTVIAGSGLLEMTVTDVVIEEAGGVQRTMALPNQNIFISGRDGNPLVARELRNGGEIRSAQLQLAALGALGNIGELLNRPESATTVIGNNTSISTVENGTVNILAGLLEGAAEAVLPLEQRRVESRIDAIDQRPRIWFHSADADVLVVVADEFTFRLD